MNCRKCGKFAWVRDAKRKHKRNGRFFVVCSTPGCNERAQCSSDTGKVFYTSKESGLVGRYFDITKEQDDLLSERPDGKSKTVRAAIDNYFKSVYASPHKQ